MSKKKKTDRNIRAKVLTVFKENPSKSFNYKQVAAKLNINDTQRRNAVIKALGQLNAQKIINQTDKGKFVFRADKKDYIDGIIEMTSSGNAYLLMSDKEDIFIAKRNTNKALDGDHVLVYQSKIHQFKGRINTKFNKNNKYESMENYQIISRKSFAIRLCSKNNSC